jgi:hypothetical protein
MFVMGCQSSGPQIVRYMSRRHFRLSFQLTPYYFRYCRSLHISRMRTAAVTVGACTSRACAVELRPWPPQSPQRAPQGYDCKEQRRILVPTTPPGANLSTAISLWRGAYLNSLTCPPVRYYMRSWWLISCLTNHLM